MNDEGQIIDTISGVYPLNKNFILASVLSGNSSFKPSYMTKRNMYLHLTQQETYYYRCKYNAVHSEGYGSSATQAANLTFSGDLGVITSKKSYKGQYHVLLLGVDIDAHDGETDAQAVENWLKKSYFEQSYWEPSSNFAGRHGYIKVAYPCNTHISDVITTFKELFTLLNSKRNQSGFQASLDIPCGLPSLISLVNENPYTEDIKEFITDTNGDQNIEIYAPKLNHKYILIKRSQAFKFPRFNQSDPHSCNISDIIQFQNLLYYQYTYFTKLLHTLKNEMYGLISGEMNNKQPENTTLSIVCSPPVNTLTQNSAQQISWSDILNTDYSLYDYWKNRSKKNRKLDYQQTIKELLSEQDTKRKTGIFYWHYSLYLQRVPTVEEAINEYVLQGLNTDPSLTSKKRIARFKYCHKFITKKFDLAKCGFHLEDWEQKKDEYIKLISDHLNPEIVLKWEKGKKKSYNLKIEELALIYYSIVKSNKLDKNRDAVIRHSFSYQRIQSIFQCVYGTGCHRAKCHRILQVLQAIGLIKKVGNHIASIRGNCYLAIAV